MTEPRRGNPGICPGFPRRSRCRLPGSALCAVPVAREDLVEADHGLLIEGSDRVVKPNPATCSSSTSPITFLGVTANQPTLHGPAGRPALADAGARGQALSRPHCSRRLRGPFVEPPYRWRVLPGLKLAARVAEADGEPHRAVAEGQLAARPRVRAPSSISLCSIWMRLKSTVVMGCCPGPAAVPARRPAARAAGGPAARRPAPPPAAPSARGPPAGPPQAASAANRTRSLVVARVAYRSSALRTTPTQSLAHVLLQGRRQTT